MSWRFFFFYCARKTVEKNPKGRVRFSFLRTYANSTHIHLHIHANVKLEFQSKIKPAINDQNCVRSFFHTFTQKNDIETKHTHHWLFFFFTSRSLGIPKELTATCSAFVKFYSIQRRLLLCFSFFSSCVTFRRYFPKPSFVSASN